MTLTREQLRGPVTALLVGGLLLALLGQLAYAAVPSPRRFWLWPLLLAGIAAFLLGGRLVVGRRVPAWLVAPMRRVAAFFDIAVWQVVVLALAPGFALLATLAAGRQLLAFAPTVAAAAWLLAIACAVAGSWQFGEPRLRVMWGDVGVTAVLFALALFLRAIATDQIPTTFSGDEGSAGLFAAMFLTGETDNLLSLGWFSFPSLYFAIQSASIAFFGQTIAALRLTSALAGALTVVAVFWLGRALFDRLTGLLASAYLAVSHYHIHMSRIGLNNVWDGLFGTLAIWGLWDGWRNGRRAAFVLCGLALGLGQYFYVSIRILPVLFLVWALAAFWRDRATFRARLPGLLLAGFIALVVFLPLGLLFAAHPDEFNAPLDRVSILGDRLAPLAAQSGQTPAAFLGSQLLRGALGFTHEPLRLLYDPGVPLLLSIGAVLFVLGVLWAVLNFDLRYLLIGLPLLAVVVSGVFSRDAPASQRYILVMPLVALFVALPLAQLVEWMRALWPRAARVALVVVALVTAVLALGDLRYYFFDAYDNYLLGGWNTLTATAIAGYLREQPIPDQQVYFFGFPRMGYYSLSTIPYLAPSMRGEDVAEPLTAPFERVLDGPTLFVFLPERRGELAQVQAAFPQGRIEEFQLGDGRALFTVYALE